MRTRLAALVGRVALLVLRALGRSGTTVPGRVALAVDPQFIADQSANIVGPKVVVSATNGKTTTAGLLRAALATEWNVVGNQAGANMAGGVASSLVNLGFGSESAGLFEVDEFWLGEVATAVQPSVVLLGNLFRDQLDRYGELDTILDRWHSAVCELVSNGTSFVACADDPGIVWVLRDVPAERIAWFGCEDRSAVLSSLPHAADSGVCRSCGSELTYAAVFLGHLGEWKCEQCGLARPEPQVRLVAFNPTGAKGSRVGIEFDGGVIELALSLPGLYNAYNATGAWAASQMVGCEAAATREAFEGTAASFGRGELFRVNSADVHMLLIKNPTGANEVVRSLCDEGGLLRVQFVLNDQIADGRDVSWIWDTDLEELVPHIEELVCSGTRAEEAALRFRYAGVEPERIKVINDSWAALNEATEGVSEVWVLPTYTAMTGLRGVLAEHGLAEKVV